MSEIQTIDVTPVNCRRDRLQDLENQIEKSKHQQWMAIAEIFRDKLWADQGYNSFPQYCKERWGWSHANGYEQVEAGNVVQSLLESGVSVQSLPTSINQTRQLAKLPAGDRAGIVSEAIAKDGKLTDARLKELRAIASPANNDEPAPVPTPKTNLAAGLQATIDLERDRGKLLERFIVAQDKLIVDQSDLLVSLIEEYPVLMAKHGSRVRAIAIQMQATRSEKDELIGDGDGVDFVGRG